ncbi:FAD-binding oxidoreductase [Nocardioides sp. YIM 152315]|uniref:FAD-binding oxidoreductase n=1 Tax=Nocardioides sp. YIM 152315 TaxID=3031760 RepID=UPI0023D9DEBC|nr:FAD-binding oxidoreductase [Nocardioides sp. YIM 152315]MDF1603223.1 FAD-binding oxidoreductase [Nocardioides sp. YIM 152315]
MPDWDGHRAGQHLDLRLTAVDGHQSERPYSIASGPADELVEVTVERLPGAGVSRYLVDKLREGDRLEVRGPVGGYFVWQESFGGPLLVIAGGPGIAPLRSILRYHRSVRSAVPVRLLYAARDLDDLVYRDELMRFATFDQFDVSITLTDDQPPGWHGYRGRIDSAMLAEVGWPSGERPLVYLCGPSAFVESAEELLVVAHHDRARIRAERFGRSGLSA